MTPRHAAIAVALCLPLLASSALAASASALLGEPARSLAGTRIGTFADLIIDARAGRVLYVIVDRGDGFVTLPARALDGRLRLDMGLAGAIAYDRLPARERFRRAEDVIGEEVRRAGDERIGVVHDIRFDPESGKVQEVLARSAERGEVSLPPAVLTWGFLPPLTPYPYEPPRYSSERKRLHDHRWK